MNIDAIPVVSVSYNSAELIADLLASFRAHYPNPVYIIDGSGAEHYPAIEAECARHAGVQFIHFDYNIHHGPGMAWAFQNLPLHGPVLVLDSDICILKRGFLESMHSALQPHMYGVGYVNHVNEGGFDVDYEDGAIRYLHPACMLCNLDVVRNWPMPIKHGAPMTPAMLALHRAGKSSLLHHLDWIREDFSRSETKHFLRHDWQGTVARTGGYHLEEWMRANQESAQIRHVIKSLLPRGARRILDLGALDGFMAQAVAEVNPDAEFDAVGMTEAHAPDFDSLGDDFFRDFAQTDCWLLDQTLARLKRPEALLARLRKVIGPDGCVLAVVPNAQHWSLQARLCVGDLRYAENGLLSTGNLRWFTRITLFEIFSQNRFRIAEGYPVVTARVENEQLLSGLRQLAIAMGANPDLACEDAQPSFYVVKAIPV